MIVGIDEVGRGCWAGPVCVGAVLLEADAPIDGLADSKTLSKKRREQLAAIIVRKARSVGIGWASAKYIDTYGIVPALKKAAAEAMQQIEGDYQEIIVDGTINLLEGRDVTLLKKADTLIPAVSAASIIAKVARDRYMVRIGERFTGYGFERHVGYGTATHKAALDLLGPSVLHRMSFSPMSIVERTMPAYVSSGAVAEEKAAVVLEDQGYLILGRNWKTRWCEIDIVAEKNGIVIFFEVKYRKDALAGSGLEYITRAKQHRMRFAAEMWLARHARPVAGSQLGAIELQGAGYEVTQLLTLL